MAVNQSYRVRSLFSMAQWPKRAGQGRQSFIKKLQAEALARFIRNSGGWLPCPQKKFPTTKIFLERVTPFDAYRGIIRPSKEKGARLMDQMEEFFDEIT